MISLNAVADDPKSYRIIYIGNIENIYSMKQLLFVTLVLMAHVLTAQDAYRTIENIPYRTAEESKEEYVAERCVLDLYIPEEEKDFPTVVWFHGGGLKAGNKYLPEELQQEGIAIAAVNYRFYPKVKAPIYIEDAAASVAWVIRNIESYGGSVDKIFVSGHSAGGYLSSMIGLDSTYLQPYNIHPNDLAGLIPFSGHTITHFTVREEQGIDGKTPTIDQYAPIAHMRQNTPPILFITGDREMELLGRYEENAYMWRMMKVIGNENVFLKELDGFHHGNMVLPAIYLLRNFVKEYSK